MKLHFIVAAAAALLCAAPIATAYDDADVVQLNVVEVEQEQGFLNQALNYLSEVEKTEEVLAETQSGKKSEGKDDKKSSSRSRDRKSRDKKDRAPSKKDREPRPTRKPKEEREPKPTRKPKEDRTPKPTRKPKKERTPKPTREPKPTPKPTRRRRTPRPTRRPTRKPTISRSSRRAIDKWIHREWREDECDVRRRLRRLMSYSCKHLEDIVCTQRRRWLSQEAIDVCEKVGLPVSYRSEDSEDLYSEDAAFDYDFMYVEDEE